MERVYCSAGALTMTGNSDTLNNPIVLQSSSTMAAQEQEHSPWAVRLLEQAPILLLFSKRRSFHYQRQR